MVAPRTRAERPADIVPAARPARNGTRRVAADVAVDRSPPPAKPRPASKASAATDKGRRNGATASASAGHAAVETRRKQSALDAAAEHLVTSIVRYDSDADVATI